MPIVISSVGINRVLLDNPQVQTELHNCSADRHCCVLAEGGRMHTPPPAKQATRLRQVRLP